MIPINVAVFAFAATGATPGTLIANLAGRLDTYEHTISAVGGFESLTCTLVVSFEEAIDWLNNRLMCGCIAYGPDAQIIWEGYLASVEAQFGQEQRSASLEGMSNRVRVRYTTVLGTQAVTATASDTARQARYGVKDLVLSVGETVSAVAINTRDRALAQYKNPVMTPTTQIATGDLGDARLTLTFAGWYTTLGWVITARTSTSNTDTGTQVGDLIQASGVGIGATNNFLATSRLSIITTGVADTELIAADTTYQQKIESLLGKGNGTDRLAWGIYEDRAMHVEVWAGATPTDIHYQRYLGDGRLYDASDNVVQPWDARPNRMYQVVDLLDAGPASDTPDAAARFFVERVVCSVSNDSIGVALEPANTNALDALLARLGG